MLSVVVVVVVRGHPPMARGWHGHTLPRQWWWGGLGLVTYYFIMLNTNCPIIAQYSIIDAFFCITLIYACMQNNYLLLCKNYRKSIDVRSLLIIISIIEIVEAQDIQKFKTFKGMLVHGCYC